MSARIITAAQQKGRSGKSTLALHLAVAFAKKGLSTMLFDTDPQGTASQWHARRKKNDVGLLATSGWRLSRDLAMAKDANDVIVIDSPPHAEMDIKVSTRAADLVVVPVQPSPADLWAVHETIKTISGENRNALCVLNRVVPRAKITEEIAEKMKMMGLPIADTRLGNRVMFANTMEEGLTVLDEGKNASAKEIDKLAAEVAEVVGLTYKKKSKPTGTLSTKKAPPSVKEQLARKAS